MIRRRSVTRGTLGTAAAAGMLLAARGADPNTELALPDLAAHAPTEACSHPPGFLHDDACKACPGAPCHCASLGSTSTLGLSLLDANGFPSVAGSEQVWCGCKPAPPFVHP